MQPIMFLASGANTGCLACHSPAYLANDRGVLSDARGQPGLAQAAPAVQMLAQEIAKWVTHGRLLLGTDGA